MRKLNTSCLLLTILAASPAWSGQNTTELVTAFPFSAGEAANGESRDLLLSGDGRFLAFNSLANNLEAGVVDANEAYDVYVLDRQSGLHDLISRGAAEPERTDGKVGAESQVSAISDDGRWVAFTSQSEALIAGGVYPATGAVVDLQSFLFDRATRTMQLISHAPGMPTLAADRGTGGIFLSADGRFAGFTSAATNLAAGGAGNTFNQAYLFDRATGESSLITHAPGAPATFGNASSTLAGMSTDGRHLLISSSATNLVAGLVHAANFNLYLYDRQTGVFRLVTRDAASPATAVGRAAALDLSADGRFVLLTTAGVEMVAGLVDGNGPADSDVFVYDSQNDSALLVSHTAATPTTSGNRSSTGRRISDDGRFTYFHSQAGGLVAGFADNNGTDGGDVFLHDSQSGAVTLVSHAAGSPVQSGNGHSQLIFGQPVSPDGRYALLATTATDLQAGVADSNDLADIYLYDRLANSSTLVSRLGGQSIAGGSAGFDAIGIAAGDGTALFETETALDSSRPDRNATGDIYIFDSAGGAAAELLTATPLQGKTAQYQELELRAEVYLDKTGRWASWGPYLWDGRTGAIELVAHAAGSPGTPASAPVDSGPVTPDGRFVAFSSRAANVLPNGGPADANIRSVFLYDRNLDTASLVTHAAGQPTRRCLGHSAVPYLSDDARFFIVESYCDDLLPSITSNGPGPDVLLYDRALDAFEIISHGFASVLDQGDLISTFSQMAPDHSWVLYTSNSANQVSGFVDHNNRLWPPGPGSTLYNFHDLYFYDRGISQARLVSRRPGATNDGSEGVLESLRATADGASVFFTSDGDDLVTGQVAQPLARKIYRWNRATGTNELVVTQPGNPLAPCIGETRLADITPDGRFVLFSSTCQLATGDLNTTNDTYLLDRGKGEIRLISHLPGLPQTSAGVAAVAQAISADGRRIFFGSGRVTYAYDRLGGAAFPLSVAYYDEGELVPGSVAIPDDRRPAISADGGRLLLNSEDARLQPFDANTHLDHFLVTLGDLFADGFESGDTDAWSQSLP